MDFIFAMTDDTSSRMYASNFQCLQLSPHDSSISMARASPEALTPKFGAKRHQLHPHALSLITAASRLVPMPLRPFPFPLSIGTDIASIHRVQRIIERGNDNFRRYIRRFLTEGEQRLILRQHGDADFSDPASVRRLSQHLAGRYGMIYLEFSIDCRALIVAIR